ncbi:MAG TPA: pilin [Candidatus Saccharimonadales bacterium]|nr:pilin [Candidatus Saccharimonadales bacterium]
MKNVIKKSLQSLLIVPVLALGVSLVAPVLQPTNTQAVFNQGIQDGADASQGQDQPSDLFGQGGIFQTITNVLLFIIGAIAVIMLIIGGIRYVVSGGDSSAVTGAKNTILYAIVGIVVAILAYALVNFVTTSFTA